jgi:hypothetical protein
MVHDTQHHLRDPPRVALGAGQSERHAPRAAPGQPPAAAQLLAQRPRHNEYSGAPQVDPVRPVACQIQSGAVQGARSRMALKASGWVPMPIGLLDADRSAGPNLLIERYRFDYG